ncbi:MAG: hypothetical protein GC179_05350 [Anaerolineaceae bacterium]|nr:hypothetical protein [Anaerolineaceae bacterium]
MKLFKLNYCILFSILILVGLVISVPLHAQDNQNTIVVTSLSDVNSLDPAIGYDSVSWTAEMLVYRGLVTWDDDGKEIVPALAKTYTVSDDQLTFTFTLRDGVQFSNGRAITAEDVKYSFERLLNPKTASPATFIYDIITGAPEYISGEAKEITGIKVIDPQTVEYTLSRAESTWLERLALPFASVVAKEGVEEAGDNFARQPLGAGPFVLKAWDAGLELSFERNPNYWHKNFPKVDAVQIDIGVEPSVAVLQIESGEADTSLDFIPQSDYPRISEEATLSQRMIPSLVQGVAYLSYNLREAPFNDVRVRKALDMAIDRGHIVQIENGRPIPAGGLFPTDLQGNNPAVLPPKVDIDGAKKLLQDAGYMDGIVTKIYVDTDPDDTNVVQAIVQDWAQIGVKADVVALEFSQLLDIMYGDNPGEMPVLLLTWSSDYPDPSGFYQPLLKCGGDNNISGYCNQKLDDAEAAAALLPVGDARWKAYSNLEALLNDETPMSFLIYTRNFYYSSSRVIKLTSHPTYGLNFETVQVN